ncbi:hypothetical protein LTR08_001384 [Meristemomyces frigidus]|nr:hypothetical protein LTR08_001384 [Meristemomyces frigidus]
MVVFSKFTSSLVAAAAFIAPAFAHPGEHHDHIAIKRQVENAHAFAYNGKRSLDACAGSAEHQAFTARNLARRAQKVDELRQKRDITARPRKFRRDLATLEEFEAIKHNVTNIDYYDSNTPEAIVFGGNTSCILTPEVTAGPYYVTGESIRKNVKEALYSDGVDLYLEAQYIDIKTCRPVPGAYIDIWHANATGIYSGISVVGNYAADGYNSTYLRGIQPTDRDGVAAFETIFPGHYDGRATHTHLIAHMNVTLYPNSTISATSNITHIGQLFYNTELRDAVEEVYPYNTNTQPLTTNEEDPWSIEQADTYYDPFPEYVYLGEDVSDGLFAWIQIGVDVSANRVDEGNYAVAASIQADGGHVGTGPTVSDGSGAPNDTTTSASA